MGADVTKRIDRRYGIAEQVEVALLRKMAAARREVLAAAGCSTYVLGQRAGGEAIVCLCCGLGSSSQGDILQRYCGFCHEFHTEWTREL